MQFVVSETLNDVRVLRGKLGTGPGDDIANEGHLATLFWPDPPFCPDRGLLL